MDQRPGDLVAHERTATIGRAIEEVSRNFKEALDQSVEEQPLATFALAAVLGFMLGVLWKA